jgi:hypothetical protein
LFNTLERQKEVVKKIYEFMFFVMIVCVNAGSKFCALPKRLNATGCNCEWRKISHHLLVKCAVKTRALCKHASAVTMTVTFAKLALSHSVTINAHTVG